MEVNEDIGASMVREVVLAAAYRPIWLPSVPHDLEYCTYRCPRRRKQHNTVVLGDPAAH
jgi:hypothetical protein